MSFKIYFTGLIILPSVIFYTISRTAKDIFFILENPVNTESEAEDSDITEEN